MAIKKKLVGDAAVDEAAVVPEVAVELAPVVEPVVEPVEEKPIEPAVVPNEVFVDENGVECVRVTKADGTVVVVAL